MEEIKTEKKSFVRRDYLQAIEKKVQEQWYSESIYDSDPKEGQPKFMITFPFPYMNGRLHLGHAFSFSKCEFTARYKRLKGYNVLFPFGFHVTGMPIAACAQKLQKEYSTIGEDKLPAEYEEFVKILIRKRELADKKDEASIQEREQLKEKKLQYNIMRQMSIPHEEIKKFQDQMEWLKYFPPYGVSDLQKLGSSVDFRRSFITTDVNPYFNSFVEWQFLTLKSKDKIAFGKRPTVFSPSNNQPCADHDRSEGEGVGPQEYTLIKLQVVDKFPEHLSILNDRKVYLVAGTLRPETMYGQTNCYILPSGIYGAFEMKNDEVFICSERSAKNMSFQGLTLKDREIHKITDVQGTDIIGLAVKAPLSAYEKVYAIPMLSISMDKGTGIVTSVPSDSPDDWATLRDFQKKQAFREKFQLKDEQVLPFQPVPIIEIPGYSNLSAVTACDEFKVTSQNDAKQLKDAKEKTYTKGFYEGILLVGKYKGLKVQEAKPLVKADLIEANEAAIYYEPESKVVARTGEECVVAFVDQWFFKYGEESWKSGVRQHIKSSNFQAYNEKTQKEFEAALDWLSEWGCSRTFGLGTRLPWDKQYLIESLSDSTIYMAFYTISHFLQGNLSGSTPGIHGIPAEKLVPEVWDYIYLNGPFNESWGIPEEQLAQLRAEFKYWYPMDLRCSGKDLIKNHLTMSQLNHQAIWDKYNQDMLPRGFFCNGHVLVDKKKMSKSEGNFYTISDIVDIYTSDAVRVALSEAGDSLDDANFELQSADSAILKLHNLENWIKVALESIDTLRRDAPNDKIAYQDNQFVAQINLIIYQTDQAYEKMRFREAIINTLFDLVSYREDYKAFCGTAGPRLDVVLKYIEAQIVLLHPIAPHITDHIYREYLVPASQRVHNKFWPRFLSQYKLHQVNSQDVDYGAIRAYNYFKAVQRNIILSYDKLKSGKKGKQPQNEQQIKTCYLFYSPEYPQWQIDILELLAKQEYNENFECQQDWKAKVKDFNLPQDLMKKSLQFGAFVLNEAKVSGKDAFDVKLPFNEAQVLEYNQDIIKRDIGVETVVIKSIKDTDIPEGKVFQNAVTSTNPGKPQIIFV